MKLKLVAIAAALTLGLAACQSETKTTDTTTGTTTTTTTPAPAPQPTNKVVESIKEVQEKAVQICGFLPAVNTVTSLINVFTGGQAAAVTQVTEIAGAVCNAVGPQKNAQGRMSGPNKTVPQVKGVPIEGEFVK